MRYSIPLLLTLLAAAPAVAQESPATRPAEASAKTVTPEGYVRFDVNGRSLICLPADRAWVETAAGRVKAGVGPETRPADLHARLTAKRDLIVASLLKSLPALKPSQAETLIDERLLPELKKLSEIRPRIVFLVSPAEHLKRAVREGWTDSRVRYNRIADQLELDRTVTLTGPESGESTVAALFDPSDTVQNRTTLLAQYMVATEEQVQLQLAARANTTLLVGLAEFIAETALKELPGNEDQVWMKVGLANALAARYVSMIHGSPVQDFIQALIVAPQQTAVAAASIDLIRPVPLSSLREEFVPSHVDARRRKSIAVMYVWLRDAGDDKLVPTIEAVTRAKPADGVTLVKIINDASGIDLTDALEPR